MGYNTDFEGEFTVTPPLSPEQVAYLTRFSETRRVKRNAELAAQFPDPLREAVGLPIGLEGGYYTGQQDHFGQEHDPSVVNGNIPPGQTAYYSTDNPEGQPGLWCQWEPSEDGAFIAWNEAEKFYQYIAWIRYLITHFLIPWGRTLNGEVTWYGEEQGDTGKIVIENNRVTIYRAELSYVELDN